MDLAGAAELSDPAFRDLIIEHIQHIGDDIPFDSQVHGYFLIVEAGDTLETINAQVGFDLLSRTVEVLEDCGSLWNALWIMDDSGYGVELLIPKEPGISAEVLDMCQRYAFKNQS